MDIDKLMNDIVEELQIVATPHQLFMYDPKVTHIVIRKHLTKFNNVALADVRQQRELLINAFYYKDGVDSNKDNISNEKIAEEYIRINL